MRLTIATDFDRTIHDCDHPVEGRMMGPPMPGAVEALTAMVKAGHKIIIHSCRGDKRNVIRDWMTFYKVPYHEIHGNKPKPVADIYIDDKGWRFTSWDDQLLLDQLGIPTPTDDQ